MLEFDELLYDFCRKHKKQEQKDLMQVHFLSFGFSKSHILIFQIIAFKSKINYRPKFLTSGRIKGGVQGCRGARDPPTHDQSFLLIKALFIEL